VLGRPRPDARTHRPLTVCMPDISSSKKRLEQAEARAEQAEARTEQAKTRAELAETRTEQAETRTELAKTRTEQAEVRTEQAEMRTEQAVTRSEQAETTLQRMVHKDDDLLGKAGAPIPDDFPADEKQNSPVELLTSRQREVLQLIAKGHNTKAMADLLHLSPKTVEYHRQKLMAGLNVHDVPGLVLVALRMGLVSMEG
jgi:DNA-binding CsgD family transcriptional regulator